MTNQPDPDAALIRDLDRVLWNVEGNYQREGSFAPSRFEGQTLQTAQARAVLREVRRPGGMIAQAIAAELERIAHDHADGVALDHFGASLLRGLADAWREGRR